MGVTFPYSFGIHHAEVRIEQLEQSVYRFSLTFTDGHTDSFVYNPTEAGAGDQLQLHSNESRKEAVSSFHILLEKNSR